MFAQATTYTCLLFLSGTPSDYFEYATTEPAPAIIVTEPNFAHHTTQELSDKPWIFGSSETTELSNRLEKLGVPLLQLPAQMNRGSSTGNDQVFLLKRTDHPSTYLTQSGTLVEIESEILRTPIFATDFSRYNFRPNAQAVMIFPYITEAKGKLSLIPEAQLRRQFPQAYKYLSANKKTLEQRKQYKTWYAYSAPRSLDAHENAQLVVPLLADRGLFAELPSDGQKYCLMAGGGFSITIGSQSLESPHYVLGLLNSRLLFWKLRSISNQFRGGWITCTKQYVGILPMRTIDFTNPADVAQHDRLVALVQQMLDLHRRLAAEKNPQTKTVLQRQIEATDGQIDRLVYGLYGLTEEEIAVVEG